MQVTREASGEQAAADARIRALDSAEFAFRLSRGGEQESLKRRLWAAGA